MKAKFVFLFLAVFVLSSCGKRDNETAPDPAQSKETDINPSPVESLQPEQPVADNPVPSPPVPVEEPEEEPVDESLTDTSTDQLTYEEMLEQFHASGITRIPRYVAEDILAQAMAYRSIEDQAQYVVEEAAAWQQVSKFKDQNQDSDMPQAHRSALVNLLSNENGGSWQEKVGELDEQVAASEQVMKLRMQGIPGMSQDESSALILNAIARHLPDYKKVLEVVRKSPQSP